MWMGKGNKECIHFAGENSLKIPLAGRRDGWLTLRWFFRRHVLWLGGKMGAPQDRVQSLPLTSAVLNVQVLIEEYSLGLVILHSKDIKQE
jgi:hypothetical protein